LHVDSALGAYKAKAYRHLVEVGPFQASSAVQGSKEDKHKRIHESAEWQPAEQNPLRKTEAVLAVLGEPCVVTAAGQVYSASGTSAHIVCHCRATSRKQQKLPQPCDT